MIKRESTSESSTAHQESLELLKKSAKYLEKCKLLKEDETTGVRYRKNGKGKTSPENESSCVRKIGSTALVPRNIIERIQKNEVLAKKFKLNASHRNLGERNLGQSFISGENVNMEEDDIYDEISAMGTLDRKFAKKLHNFKQSYSSSQQNRGNNE